MQNSAMDDHPIYQIVTLAREKLQSRLSGLGKQGGAQMAGSMISEFLNTDSIFATELKHALPKILKKGLSGMQKYRDEEAGTYLVWQLRGLALSEKALSLMHRT